MPKEPLTKYRPMRTDDNKGGYTETLGTAATIYGTVTVHNSNVYVDGVDIHEDVKVGDVIVVVTED